MSSLYGELSGSGKTTATRRGNDASGISTHIRSWNRGVAASIMAVAVDSPGGRRRRGIPGEKQRYKMTIELTGGSNNPMDRTEVQTIYFEE